MSDKWRKLSDGNWVMKNLHPNSLLMLNRNVKSTTTLEILLYPSSCRRENQWGEREKEMDLEREREREREMLNGFRESGWENGLQIWGKWI